MKKYLGLLVLILFIGSIVYAVLPDTKDYDTLSGITRQYPYIQINNVTTDDTALVKDTKYWDSVNPDSAVFIPIRPSWSVVELAFYCYGDGSAEGDPNTSTFNFFVYAVRRFSSARLVYTGYAQCGEVELSCNPINGTQYNSGALEANESYKWVDTIDPNGTGDTWISSITLSGNSGTETGGNIATLSLDWNGYWGMWVAITGMTSKAVTNVYCVATGYD